MLHTDNFIGNKYYKRDNCHLQMAFQRKNAQEVNPKIIFRNASSLRFELQKLLMILSGKNYRNNST